jgi:hypothetical protein
MPVPDARVLSIAFDGKKTTARLYSARPSDRRRAALILAHGAGAGHLHPVMVNWSRGLSERGVDVLTFNFLYMEERRKVPDRMPQLTECFRSVVETARAEIATARDRLFIGGKSMGGRAATHLAAEDASLPVSGIVLLGYPLHPPGRPDQLRDAHLPGVRRPMLFVQGSRDAFGTPSELKPILASLNPLPTLHHIEGGDHSFKLAGRDAKSRQADVHRDIENTIADWMDTIV